jgi:hypothetical protein
LYLTPQGLKGGESLYLTPQGLKGGESLYLTLQGLKGGESLYLTLQGLKGGESLCLTPRGHKAHTSEAITISSYPNKQSNTFLPESPALLSSQQANATHLRIDAVMHAPKGPKKNTPLEGTTGVSDPEVSTPWRFNKRGHEKGQTRTRLWRHHERF